MAAAKNNDLEGRRHVRNLAVLVALLALVVLLFTATVVKLGPDSTNPSGDTEKSWGTALVEWLEGGAPGGEAAR